MNRAAYLFSGIAWTIAGLFCMIGNALAVFVFAIIGALLWATGSET